MHITMPMPMLTSAAALKPQFKPGIRRWIFASLAVGLIASLMVSAYSRAPLTADRTAMVNGHMMTYRVQGSGKSVVVLMAGLGDDMSTFEETAAALSRHATVIIYDRPGYGHSEASPGVRDALAAATDLRALLSQTGIPGPYVLAGHSLGGLYAEYFAARYPDLVSGLILEESRPAEFTKRCLRLVDRPMCAAPSWAGWFMGSGGQGELTALDITSSQVEAAAAMQDKPVLILSRSPDSAKTSFDVLWADAQDGLEAKYPGSTHLHTLDGSHSIHGTHTAWFTSSVEAFLSHKQ